MAGETFEFYHSHRLNPHTIAICPGMAEDAERHHALKDVLVNDFHVVLFNQPGVSKVPLSEINIKDIAKKNHQDLMNLGIETYSVIGHSFGGYVAQQMALDNKAELNKLILVSTSCGSFKQLDIMEFMLKYSDLFKKHHEKAIQTLFHPSFIDDNPDEYNKFVAKRLLGDAKTYFEYLKAGAKFSSFAQLKDIVQPTFAIYGDSDLVMGPGQSEIFADLIKNISILEMNNTGHYPQLEKPVEFADAIIRFMYEEPVGTRRDTLSSPLMKDLLSETANFKAATRKSEEFDGILSDIFANPLNLSVEERLNRFRMFISKK